MRDFKFRVWDKKDKKILYFNGIFNNKPYTETSSMPQYESIKVDHEVLTMQYTGLKDKNGVEIYEGDILQCNNEKTVVRFINGMFIQKRVQVDSKPTIIIPEFSKVIGNIYETPEKLKEK